MLDAVEDVDFVRFGGEDVVRHKLVQRIVEAYDVHSQRRGARRLAAAARARAAGDPQRLSAMLDVEVFGERPRARRAVARARSRRSASWPPRSRGVESGHVAVEFVAAERIAELNGRHRGKDAPTDVLSFPIDGARRLPARAAASSATS